MSGFDKTKKQMMNELAELRPANRRTEGIRIRAQVGRGGTEKEQGEILPYQS